MPSFRGHQPFSSPSVSVRVEVPLLPVVGTAGEGGGGGGWVVHWNRCNCFLRRSPPVRYELLMYRTFVEKNLEGQISLCDPPPGHPGIFKQWIVPELQGAPGTCVRACVRVAVAVVGCRLLFPSHGPSLRPPASFAACVVSAGAWLLFPHDDVLLRFIRGIAPA